MLNVPWLFVCLLSGIQQPMQRSLRPILRMARNQRRICRINYCYVLLG